VRDELTGQGRDNVQVLVISFAAADLLDELRRHLELPFPIASDPDRRAYTSYELGRASRWRVWHPAVVWRYAALLLRGRKPLRVRLDEDRGQLGGDFIIDGAGMLRFAYLSTRADDRPTARQLVAELDRLG